MYKTVLIFKRRLKLYYGVTNYTTKRKTYMSSGSPPTMPRSIVSIKMPEIQDPLKPVKQRAIIYNNKAAINSILNLEVIYYA